MNNVRKLDFIDATRAIAIMMVVLVHTSVRFINLDPVTTFISYYGIMGVQLFFVASALTLCLSFEERKAEKYAILSFYVRRFFRIAPLYYFGIILYFLIDVKNGYDHTGGFSPDASYTPANVVQHLLFVHDFSPSAQSFIVPGGWSIGVEMAFYAIFPVLFAIYERWNFSYISLMLSIVIVALLNLICCLVIAEQFGLSLEIRSFTYYFISNHLAVFLTGFLTYKIITDTSGGENVQKTGTSGLALFIFFTLMSAAVWTLNYRISFLLTPTLSGISFCGLIVWLSTFKRIPNILRKIGKYSFAIYILHFLFTKAIEPALIKVWDSQLPTLPIVQLGIMFLINLVFSFGIASLVHRYIEVRGIDFGRELISKLQR
jgi:peptidoglycan/LPS O-acetylase OafA/YrhL